MARVEQVLIPDIGDAKNVVVTEILVATGDRVEMDDSLIVLESDKASMEIPSPWRGVVRKIEVSIDDEVDEGDPILSLELEEEAVDTGENQRHEAADTAVAEANSVYESPVPDREPPAAAPTAAADAAESRGVPGGGADAGAAEDPDASGAVHAGPAVRRLAREYGVDLAGVSGTGSHGRILKEDLQRYVKVSLSPAGQASLPAGAAMAPQVNFSAFGDVELVPVSRIRRASARNLHQSWVTIPHVTHFDEADITALESFRRERNQTASGETVRLTLLPFILKCVTHALVRYPRFMSSLDATGDNLIFKHYCNVGIAVATDDGLVVPVIKQADEMGVVELAQRAADLAGRARQRKLRIDELQGSCFSVSVLGGIGGTGFTPIINSPEVAVLGVSRASVRPVYVGADLEPRTLLPLALSYDHRVIDGAEAAEFTAYLCRLLTDMREIFM